uniref:Uncharacterized protein n=1 Tax=Chrysotila carterae TaxID=13221 RepID=A0A7S4F1W7_CHRCT
MQHCMHRYDGGGTYFYALRRAVRPEQGQLLAFSGALLHGGEPIVRGVRYVLAAFLYIEGEEPDRELGTARSMDLNCPKAAAERNGGHVGRKRSRALLAEEAQQPESFSFGFG